MGSHQNSQRMRLESSYRFSMIVYAYIPDKLPLGLSLPPRIVKKLSSADNKLGTLAGITGREFIIHIIGSPMLHREAILSSRMEGTLTTPIVRRK